MPTPPTIDVARLIWPEKGSAAEALTRHQSQAMIDALLAGAARVVEETDGLRRPVPESLWLQIAHSAGSLFATISDMLFAASVAQLVAETMIGTFEEQRHMLMARPRDEQRDTIYVLLTHIFGSVFGIMRALREGARIDDPILRVLEAFLPIDDRVAAADELANGSLRRPVFETRWRFHYRALAHQYGDDLPVIVRESTRNALLMIGKSANEPHGALLLSVENRQRSVIDAKGALIPRFVLPERFFASWIRTQVSNEVMDALLPDWRDLEARWRLTRRLRDDSSPPISADDLRALNAALPPVSLAEAIDIAAGEDPLASLLARERAEEIMVEMNQALNAASPQQLRLAKRAVRLERNDRPLHGLAAEAARLEGIPEAQARKQRERLRKKINSSL